MPKRSLDIDAGVSPTNASQQPDKSQRKTERSHEENQERAYIAASRRADRSIEARVQSARMASEIHKRRTGKAFRISEQIVRNEEMYEEEEDDFPRSVYILGPHMQTQSADLNARVEAYLSNRMAMSAFMRKANEDWQSNQIHELFAKSFPNANQQAQQLTQSMSDGMYNQQQATSPQSPVTPSFQQVNYQQESDRRESHDSQHSAVSIEEPSTIMSSPSSPATAPTPKTRDNSIFDHVTPGPALEFGATFDSPFTTELPAEAKMLMSGNGMSLMDPIQGTYYEQTWSDPNTFYGADDLIKFDPSATDLYNVDGSWDQPDSQQAALDQQQIEDNWNDFINDTAWSAE